MSQLRSSASTRGAGAPLSLEALLYLVPLDASPESVTSLDLSNKAATELPKQIKLFKSLRKLDVRDNMLTSTLVLSPLANLTVLNLSHNRLTSLEGLKPLTRLTVLTVSNNNNLRSLDGVQGSASTLKALIANDNNITLLSSGGSSANDSAETNYDMIAHLSACETIVLSRNPKLMEGFHEEASGGDVNNIGAEAERRHPLSCFAEVSQLRKLSLSECGIQSLPLRWYLPLVHEVRLARNHLSSIPEAVILRSVQTLDVSNNQLANIVELRRCRFLKHLNVKGNPLCGESGSGEGAPASPWWSSSAKMHMIISRMFSELQQIDGAPFKPISKEEYLAARAVNATTPEKKRCRESPADGMSAVTEELTDVVFEAPATASAQQGGRGGSVVRRERVAAPQHVVRNTKAAGAAAVELLRKQRHVEHSGW